MNQKLILLLMIASLTALYYYEETTTTITIEQFTEIEIGEIGAIRNPVIYEISLRPWLYELSRKYSKPINTLNDIPNQEWSHLKSVGVNYVWLMGIWELGDYGLNFDRTQQDQLNFYRQTLPNFQIDDVIGSPYAVKNYVCNPKMGSDDDIRALKQKLNALGLKLMLDFVPNHSAVDHPFVSSNPEYYIRSPRGTQAPFDRNRYLENGLAYGSDMWDSAWKDTAQWNYWNTDTRAYLKSVINKISSLADGIRCDMSMIILNDLFYAAWKENLDSWGYTRPRQEFWAEAIGEAKSQHPDVIFLAEVYWDKEQDLINNGFDYVYEKKLLDTLATQDLNAIRQNINNINEDYAIHSNRFVENHDEVRAVQKFSGKDYIANAAAMLSYTLPGAKFIFHGQLEGFANKLDVHLRRAREESGSDYTKYFYTRLMPIIARDVFRNGKWERLEVQGDQAYKFFAWKMVNANEKIVCIINFSEGQGYAKIRLPDASSGTQQIRELMSLVYYTRDGDTMRNNGLEVIVDGWNGQIFKYE